MAHEEMLKTFQSMVDCYNAGDFKGMANLYTPDCKVYTPKGVGEGRQYMEDELRKFHEAGWQRQRMGNIADVNTGDNIATVGGDFYLTDAAGNDVKGTSLCFLQNIGGKWFVKEDTMNLQCKSVEEELTDFLMLWKHLYDTGDFNQMVQTMYTANCRICPPGLPPFNGKHEVMTAFSLMKGFGIATMHNDIKGATVCQINADTVYVSGDNYACYNRHGGELSKGRGTACFKKEDGKWKIHWDVFNTCA